MPRGRPKKKPTRKRVSSPSRQPQLEDQEVERQVAAIRAVRDVEMEQLLTELCLMRSFFSEEQLRAPAVWVFEESFLNLLVVRDVESKGFYVEWKQKDDLVVNKGCGYGDFHTSVLNQFSSVGFLDFSAIPSTDGFEFSSNTVKTSFLGADNLKVRDLGLEGPSDAFAV